MTITSTTFQDWLFDTLDEGQREDLAMHGADAGWPGLTYTSDCVALYNQFETEIWEALIEDAENSGYSSVPAFIATFQRQDMADNPDTFKNLLVWYMAERVCRNDQDSREL